MSASSNSHFIDELGVSLPRVTTILKIISKGDFYDAWLKKQGQNADKISSEAADKGSGLHNLLERIGKGESLEIQGLSPQERGWVLAFQEWRDVNVEKFLETEKLVYHKGEGYCGTLDSLVLLRDKRIALLDYKTSKYFYNTYDLQVSAYLRAYENMYDIKIDTAFILRFEKDETKKLFEVKEVNDIAGNFDMFLTAFKLWRWNNQPKEKK